MVRIKKILAFATAFTMMLVLQVSPAYSVCGEGAVKVYTSDVTASQLFTKSRETLTDTFLPDGTSNKTETFNITLKSPTVSKLISDGMDYSAACAAQNEDNADTVAKINAMDGVKTLRRNNYLVNTMTITATQAQAGLIAAFDGVVTVCKAGHAKLLTDIVEPLSAEKTSANLLNTENDGEGTVIAVIDSGINPAHETMVLDEGVTTAISKEKAEEKIESLGYGRYYNEKIPFYFNYADMNYNVTEADDTSHGMHVSAIAAGNSVKKTGTAPNAQILALRVFPDDVDAGATDFDIVRAIEDAVFLGADIINLSLGNLSGFSNDGSIYSVALKAAKEKGVIVCCAAGNDGSSTMGNETLDMIVYDNGTVATPASFDESFSVAATKGTGEIAYFSSVGPLPDLSIGVEIAAPGQSINSASNTSYVTMSGTSMATPYISGVSAIVKKALTDKGYTQNITQTNDIVTTMIMNTADPIIQGGIPVSVRAQGAGFVNMSDAIASPVTATYNGKAQVELGVLSETGAASETEFIIELQNHSAQDANYTLSPEKVYYKTTSGSYTLLPDASITYDKTAVTVPANGTIQITATLELASATTPAYIEGYINIKGEGVTDLSLAMLAYNGDWTQGSVFLTDSGALEACIYTDAAGANKEKTTVVSPNDDGCYDNIYPMFYQYRNAYSISASITDSNGNVLSKNSVLNYSPKDIYSYYVSKTDLHEKFDMSYISTLGMYASYYNSSTGTVEDLTDGNYRIKLDANTDAAGEKTQTLFIPFEVDTTPPEISDISVTTRFSRTRVSFKINDKNGLFTNPYFEGCPFFVMDMQSGIVYGLDEMLDFNYANGKYTFTAPTGSNLLCIGSYDSVFNYAETYVTLNDYDTTARDYVFWTSAAIGAFNYDSLCESMFTENDGTPVNDSVIQVFGMVKTQVTDINAKLYDENNNTYTSLRTALLGDGMFAFEIPEQLLISGQIKYTVRYDVITPTGSYSDLSGSDSDIYYFENTPNISLLCSQKVSALNDFIVSGTVEVDGLPEKVEVFVDTTPAEITPVEGTNRVNFSAHINDVEYENGALINVTATDFANGEAQAIQVVYLDENPMRYELSFDNIYGLYTALTNGFPGFDTTAWVLNDRMYITELPDTLKINGVDLKNTAVYDSSSGQYSIDFSVPVSPEDKYSYFTVSGTKDDKNCIDRVFMLSYDCSAPQIALSKDTGMLPDFITAVCPELTGYLIKGADDALEITVSDNRGDGLYPMINNALYLNPIIIDNCVIGTEIKIGQMLSIDVFDGAGNEAEEMYLVTADLPVIGDIDLDGDYSAADALCALQMAVDLISPSDVEMALADYDSNGQISAVDALMILKLAVQ